MINDNIDELKKKKLDVVNWSVCYCDDLFENTVLCILSHLIPSYHIPS